MARSCWPARRRAPAIWVGNSNGTSGRVGVQNSSLSKLLRCNWSLEKSIATGTHNSEPLDHLERRLAAPAVKREAEGGLGKMTRRKREIVGLTNERDFPYLVELTLPPEGFRSVFLEIDTFHRERRIPVRRGRSRHDVEQFYIRFCFPDAATADAFRNRFGGECLTHAPGKPKPRTSATSSDATAVKREAEEERHKTRRR